VRSVLHRPGGGALVSTPVPVAVEIWGVCGPSGSGKTTLVRRLVARLTAECVAVLPFDAYYRDQSHLDPDDRALVNYDHPDSLDIELFVTHLDELRAGRAVEAPVYDFGRHVRTGAVQVVEARPVVLCEGILLGAIDAVRSRLDLSIYLDVPDHVCLERRTRRDVAERGRSAEDIARQYAATVRPMFERFVAPNVARCDRVVAYEDDRTVLLDELGSMAVGGAL
jgi:uridine kinase